LQLLYRILDVCKICKNEDIDIIHAHTQRSGLVVAFSTLFMKIKFVYTPHGFRHMQKQGLSAIFHYLTEVFILFMAHRVTAITISEILEFPVFKNKFTMIKSYIDVKPHNIALHDTILKPTIVMVGSVDKRKNYELFLKISTYLKDCRFKWVGSGPELYYCLELIDSGNFSNVSFVGHKNSGEVFHALNEADIFLMTSTSEGFPLSILEAMYFKACIVSNEFKGVHEIVEHNVTGVVFNNNDATDAVKKLRSVIDDGSVRGMLTDNAKEFVDAYTDKDRFQYDVYQVYESLI
jgi:glycosyltransferase involved in cell wall biosynthesis